MRAADLTHEIAGLRLEVWRVGKGRFRVTLSRSVAGAGATRYRNDFRWNDLPDLARMLEELYDDMPPGATRRPKPWNDCPSRFDVELSREEVVEELQRDPRLPPESWPPHG